MLTYGALVYAS